MKEFFKSFGKEFINSGIGWIIGLLAAKLTGYFFTERGWQNLWGLATSKTAVSSTTFGLLEFTTEVVVGFMVLTFINKVVMKKLLALNNAEKE